ncbi:hypothetical protein [Psychroflexus planctonicus]|uniref:N-acetyltransferase domain-containing protein n=1 Tax=Psychroflexus planctonicus TaxID=1526575 RepID=A0ABQ1SI50_9FLAO|nr:hypothetical protein [Psychroflexus planctonicus]GGE41118.1 hypothetical protein GCM10010832_21450 [Psychroflexus planctonicus]
MNITQRDLKVNFIDFKTYEDQILSLREKSWKKFHDDLSANEFYSLEDKVEDLKSKHCGIVLNKKLIASYRLMIINTIAEVPYQENYKNGEVINKKWYIYNQNNDGVYIHPKVACTGRMVIDMNYRKENIPEKLISFWISYVKKENIKTLLSYPTPWMLNKLYINDFKYQKTLKNVFKPLPKIDLILVKKEF